MGFSDPKPNQHSRLTLDEAIAQYRGRVGVIYRIYCTESNVSYVGETRAINKGSSKPSRIKSHYTALKKGCHPCRELQAAWDASNGTSIKDEILEVVAPVDQQGIGSTQKIRAREEYWREQYSAAVGQIKKDWHYPLKALELRMLKDSGVINNAALVYFILKLKNPWCDRPVRVNLLELAVEWEIPESSVYEAIGKLKEAEVIQINQAEIVISWTSHSQQNPLSGNPESVQDSRMDSEIPECTLENQNKFQDSRTDSEIPENRIRKATQQKASSSPQTIQTYSDFIQTLSEGERENFWEFGKKKADAMPKPPELPLKWIEANWEELRSQWEQTLEGRAAVNSQVDWTQHPNWVEWLAQMREGVPRFVALGTCFDNKTRRVIADWSLNRGLIWGAES